MILRSRLSERTEKVQSYGAKSVKDIPRAFPVGSEIVVQITKAQIGSKGPRTTTNLSLPGRFLVLMPYWRTVRNLSQD